MTDETREVRFEYVFPPGLRTVHADGFFGGWTPREQFRIDFLLDLWDWPKAETRAFNKEGKPVGKTEQEGATPGMMVRESQVRVIMSVKALDQLIEWLQEKRAEHV
jgi:hypothetical protein